MTSETACLWCGENFTVARRHGSERRFCSTAHRRAFDQGARAWVREAIAVGTLTIAELQKAPGKARALRTGQAAPGPALAVTPFKDPQRRERDIGLDQEG